MLTDFFHELGYLLGVAEKKKTSKKTALSYEIVYNYVRC